MTTEDKNKLLKALEDKAKIATSQECMKMWMLGWIYCQQEIREIIEKIPTDEETEYKESLEEMRKLAMRQNIIDALKKGGKIDE